MFYLVSNNIIIGTTDNPDSENPEYIFVYEGPNATLSELYFDGQSVVYKPNSPGENFYWSEQERMYKEKPIFNVTGFIQNKWSLLSSKLRNTPLWQKLFQLSSSSLAANTYVTLLIHTIDNTHIEEDLKLALTNLKSLNSSLSSPAISLEEITYINNKLKEYNFSFII